MGIPACDAAGVTAADQRISRAPGGRTTTATEEAASLSLAQGLEPSSGLIADLNVSIILRGLLGLRFVVRAGSLSELPLDSSAGHRSFYRPLESRTAHVI
jgi:hypothetical protein